MKLINLKGRIGNNLFQYALYFTLKNKCKTPVLVYGWDEGFQKYFEKVSWVDSFYFRKIIHRLITFFPKKTYSQYDFEPLIDVKKGIENNIVLDGYFQSLLFFENYEDVIRKNIKIKTKYLAEFNERYGKLYQENKILAIHCRLGDYINWGNESLGGKNLVLPISYYKNALKNIEDIESHKIVLITDDKELAKERFDFLEGIEVFSESEIIDFQLIKNATSIIISNSTFSWWAAFLSNTASQILAPEFFVGFKIKKDFPEGIYDNTNFKIVSFEYEK
ncbi:alpha-1,2-fucosyltransferase [Epilithonimonas hispanica]|uniref:Glycosyl transferase family 11 n=1 Tax=Epilithonimonas hispanica TaxID=358687 RepID=A0A3D9D1M7_9FLAO|nr:alpha-1,2-fucosyltransferase [Epilithonimonas hispanica]REC71916.1 hypothetical protein DRF58_04585 [Epilithonimonas hispanica]